MTKLNFKLIRTWTFNLTDGQALFARTKQTRTSHKTKARDFVLHLYFVVIKNSDSSTFTPSLGQAFLFSSDASVFSHN